MSRITKATEVTSAVIEELGTNIKVWQGMLKDAVESGDRALENSLRKEIKDAASELKKRSTALVPTDKPAKETTSIGLPKGQETEYFSKQLETPVSRAENVTEQARINRAEAIKRGSAQGTGPTIEAEGTKALVPYKEPIFNPELMPKDDSVFSRVKDADIIDTTEVPSPVSTVQNMRDNKKLAMGAGLTATAASMTGSSPQNRAEQPAGLSDAQASQLGNDLLADINRPEAQAVAKLDRQAAKEKPKKPSSLKEAIAAASNGKAPSPAEPTPSPYEQSMAELKGERATAKAERDADLRRAEIGELASIIG